MSQTDLKPVESTETTLTAYQPFKQQLAEIKNHNAKLVFDYRDKKGNEEARSHVHKLRQTKAAIEKKRKEEKAESLEYGRKVDAQAYALIEEVEEMIQVHAVPLENIKAEEEARVAKIMAVIDGMAVTAESVMDQPSNTLRNRLLEFAGLPMTIEAFGEFLPQAMAAQNIGMEFLKSSIATAEKRESDAAELERLRKEAEERRVADEKRAAEELAARLKTEREAAEKKAAEDAAAQKERDRIAAEEAEKQRQEREAAEKAAAVEAERAMWKKKEEEMIAEAQRTATEQLRKQEEAVETERLRRKAEDDAKALAELEKAANVEHRRKIHQGIVAALVGVINDTAREAANTPEKQAQMIVRAICGDAIPNVKINY